MINSQHIYILSFTFLCVARIFSFSDSPEASIVVPDNLFEGDALSGVLCIAAIGYPHGKLFMRVKYADTDEFVNKVIDDPSTNIYHSLSEVCRSVAVLSFADILDSTRDVNNSIIQCGILDTPVVASNTGIGVVSSSYEFIRIIPGIVYHGHMQEITPIIYLSMMIQLSNSYISCSLGPVVQSVVSLTSSLRVISLTVLADSIHNILIFFAEKM